MQPTETAPIFPRAAPVAAVPARAGLGLGLLVALVVGSILGSGIFGLPQNMAAGAGTGAILIGWATTGVGMLMLALTYQMLSRRRPDLDNGVYAYARALSGEYVGFNSAWGYWVSAWIGNVGYLVAAFGALGMFFPAFGEGNTPAAVLGASVVVWVVHALVLRGIQGAAVLNAVVTVAKVLPLLLFIVLVALAFQVDTFRFDFWGAPALGSVLDQVRSTMLVTVWVFIGIEGASVYSARAARRDDVGRATVLGFLITLALLMAVSLLSLGIFTQPQLAALKNPSMAAVLERAVGHWGALLVYAGVIVSVGGGFLAWTLLAAESLLMEEFGEKPLHELSFCYLGDARFNMGCSLLVGGTQMGMDVRIAAPRALQPPDELVAQMRTLALSTGARIRLETDPLKAVAGADFLYTDVWVSMGEPASVWAQRIEQLLPYQVNAALMQATGKARTRFMHCLPAFHNLDTEVARQVHERHGLTEMEVSDEVFESEASIVFTQAENRLHTIKAVLVATLV